jgi:hypothetical protein
MEQSSAPCSMVLLLVEWAQRWALLSGIPLESPLAPSLADSVQKLASHLEQRLVLSAPQLAQQWVLQSESRCTDHSP